MYFVYVLRSKKDKTLYIGVTKDIKERFLSHCKGQNLATKTKIPWELLRIEEYSNCSLATKRERFLKTGRGRVVLRNLCHKKTKSLGE